MKSGPFSITALSALALLALPAMTAAADYSRQDANTPLAGKADGEWLSLHGKVKTVETETFTLTLNGKDVTVEMDDYDWYNGNVVLPGDRVTVTGVMDDDFYERRTIEANSVYVQKLGRCYYASSADEEGGYYSSYLAGNCAVNAEDGHRRADRGGGYRRPGVRSTGRG